MPLLKKRAALPSTASILLSFCQLRVVTKILSFQVNTKVGRESNSKGAFGFIFFLFTLKVARDHVHSSRGNSRPPALNDSPEISPTECSLRNKRFRLVSEQKETVEGDFRF